MKKFLVLILTCSLFFVSALPSFAFVVPDNTFYIEAQTSELGNIVIFVPRNYSTYFSYSGSTLISTNSSAITCYAQSSNASQYNVRFPSYDYPEYRLINATGANAYQRLTITQVTETNLPILTEFDFQRNTEGALIAGCVLFILVFLLKKR